MTGEQKKSYTARITQANPTDLCVILYEMVTDYVQEAREFHEMGDLTGFRLAVSHAGNTMLELLNSVRDGQPISDNLRSLYGFCIGQLSKASAGGRVEPLDAVETTIGGLRDAYRSISSEDKRGPVMGNSQVVYAGLTYGKGALCENLTDQGSKRGFLV